MKNFFFAIPVILAVLVSCRNNDDTVQIIDQVMNLYIDSAGQDMLNSEIEGSYQTISMNDVNGITDTAPVSFTKLFDKDSLQYIDYVAGARKILIDSSNTNSKIYESEIALIFTRKVNDSVTSTFSDTLKLNYLSNPDIFYLEKAWYNNQLVFTKENGKPNIIKITK